MSNGRRSQSTGNSHPNPAKKFIEMQGSKGYFYYYDKENKENVKLPFPLRFIIIKELASITGFNNSKRVGVWSNEVEDTTKEELVVRLRGTKDPVVRGLYQDIKDKATGTSVGGKYTRSVYVLFWNTETSEWELANLQLTGVQVYQWGKIKDTIKEKGANLYETVIVIKEDNMTFDESGSISYWIPKFTFSRLDEGKPAHKAALIKADDSYDIIVDFIKKRKAGFPQDEDSRSSQDETPSAKAPVKKDEKPKAEKSTMIDDDPEEEEDDLPF